jgi:hypothetical protein
MAVWRKLPRITRGLRRFWGYKVMRSSNCAGREARGVNIIRSLSNTAKFPQNIAQMFCISNLGIIKDLLAGLRVRFHLVAKN